MAEELPGRSTNNDIGYDQEDEPEYLVGYSRPPKSGQFRKGESGNKRGRPKGSRSFAAIVREGLAKKVDVKVDGKQQSLSVGEAVIARTLRAAAAGDKRAIDHSLRLMERYIDPDPSLSDTENPADLTLLTYAELTELSRLASKMGGTEEEFYEEQATLKQERTADRRAIFGDSVEASLEDDQDVCVYLSCNDLERYNIFISRNN